MQRLDALLQTTELIKTLHAHTVTVMALHLLQREGIKEDRVFVRKKQNR